MSKKTFHEKLIQESKRLDAQSNSKKAVIDLSKNSEQKLKIPHVSHKDQRGITNQALSISHPGVKLLFSQTIKKKEQSPSKMQENSFKASRQKQQNMIENTKKSAFQRELNQNQSIIQKKTSDCIRNQSIDKSIEKKSSNYSLRSHRLTQISQESESVKNRQISKKISPNKVQLKSILKTDKSPTIITINAKGNENEKRTVQIFQNTKNLEGQNPVQKLLSKTGQLKKSIEKQKQLNNSIKNKTLQKNKQIQSIISSKQIPSSNFNFEKAGNNIKNNQKFVQFQRQNQYILIQPSQSQNQMETIMTEKQQTEDQNQKENPQKKKEANKQSQMDVQSQSKQQNYKINDKYNQNEELQSANNNKPSQQPIENLLNNQQYNYDYSTPLKQSSKNKSRKYNNKARQNNKTQKIKQKKLNQNNKSKKQKVQISNNDTQNNQNNNKSFTNNNIFLKETKQIVSDFTKKMSQHNQNGNNSDGESSEQMPQLALRCAEFFHSLSKYCLVYYQNYKRDAASQKTKKIKKQAKGQRGLKLPKFNSNDKNIDGQQKFDQKQQGAPKKPLTAYIIYFQQKKPSFVQRYKSLNLSQLTKLIAKQWKQLSDGQKKPYLDKAADDRKRYQDEMNQYRKKCGLTHLGAASNNESNQDNINNNQSQMNNNNDGQGEDYAGKSEKPIEIQE